MRIRNNRPPFPIPSPPKTASRHAHLPSRRGSCFDSCFLVEEANRHIGWSCYPLKKPLCRDVEEEQPHGELQPVITRETKAINCDDGKKGKNHCMQEKSSQASEGLDGEFADGGNESNASTYQEDKNCSSVAINLAIVLPASSSQLGNKFPVQKRTESFPWETERARKREEDAKVEVKIETAKLQGQEDVDEEDASRTWSINCVVNCQCSPPSIIYTPQMHEKQEEMSLEEIFVEPREKPRRGRKWKLNYQSDDSYKSTAPSIIDSQQRHEIQEEMSLEEIFVEPREKPRRGRKRKLNYQSDDSYKSTADKRMQKPKRGRPKGVKNKSVNGNEGCGEPPKPRRGRPKVQKPKRGRPKKTYSQSIIGNEDKQKT